MQEREIRNESPAKKLHEEILAMWRCTDKRCQNNNTPEAYCWIDNASSHIFFTTKWAKVWASTVLRDDTGRITKQTPPVTLISDMRAYTKKQLKSNKQEQQKEQQTGTPFPFGSYPQATPPYNQYNAFGGAFQQPAPVPYLPYGRPFASPIQLPPTLPYTLQNVRTSELQKELEERAQELSGLQSRSMTTPIRASRTSRPSATPGRQVDLRSSPVEGDLADFIEWIKKRRPRNETADYDDAYNKLMDEGLTTDLIQEWKSNRDPWVALDIKYGISIHLARGVSRWGRERDASTLYNSYTPRLPERPSPRRPRPSARPSHAPPNRSSAPARSVRGNSLILASIERGNGAGGEGFDDNDNAYKNQQISSPKSDQLEYLDT